MASLSLIQNYSSDEEEDQKYSTFSDSEGESNDEDENNGEQSISRFQEYQPLKNPPRKLSILPSALDAFSEVAGTPEFLNNAVGFNEKKEEMKEQVLYRGKSRREKKNLPAGVVMEAKAQLVGIHDRVRSDIEGKSPAPPTTPNTIGETKRVISASNPDAKDAADLLRMCIQCGVPKTYSHARGMVCPICGDRPPLTNPQSEAEKRKGSTIKDKEKNKRMKGQSSHASWKSETEMHLRQQFD